MGFDIRLPIGLMFSVLGLILVVFGAITQFTRKEMYNRSLGINVNLWWGMAITLFGLVMLLLAWRASKKGSRAPL
jgi:multisubunit Na+/H+ antiporter MnhG subunit